MVLELQGEDRAEGCLPDTLAEHDHGLNICDQRVGSVQEYVLIA